MFTTLAPLILASASPRRRDFLQALGIDFTIVPATVDENPRPGEAARAYVERICAAKAAAVANDHPQSWVLAADTAVILDDRILGKPADQAAAVAMLLELRGRTHEVWTAFCLVHGDNGVEECRSVATEVVFSAFPPLLAQSYAATGDPLDKAGAYGIQGPGGVLVERISGSYSNVVGLPLSEVVTTLTTHAVIKPKKVPAPPVGAPFCSKKSRQHL